MYEEDILTLREILKASKNLCVFTGAGISVPSGIPDFRSADGLYNQESGLNIPPEQIISHSFFVRHPKEFYEFYKSKMLYPDALPNAAHRYFAALEKEGKRVSVVTQNIDGLHQKAGSVKVFELHGSVWRNRCTKCGKCYPAEAVLESPGVPRCACGGIIKPDVVLYEEPLDPATLDGAVRCISEADTLIVGGTSLNVYPAAGLVDFFRGENLVVINKGETGKKLTGALVIDSPIARFLSEV